jgi:O-antigen/teichoic acid export membrane protein
MNAGKNENSHSYANEIKKFVKDIGYIGIAEISVAIGGLIFIPLITKTLGARGYGLWQQMLVTVGILSPIASLGLNNALVRFLPIKEKKKDKQEIFYSILIFKLLTSIIIASLIVIFADFIAGLFFDDFTIIVIITALVFLLGGSNIICYFYFRAIRKIKLYSILRILDSYSKVILAYYMILNGKGVLGVILAYFAVEIFFTTLSLILIIHDIGFKFPKFTNLKTYLKYGIPLVPTGLSLWVISFSDRYVITYMLGIKVVGIYAVAYTLGFSFYMVMELINFVLVPTISKSYDQGKMSEVKDYLSSVFKIYLLLAIPAVVGLSIFSKDLLSLLTTQDIALAGWIIVPIIAICTLFAGVGEVFDKTLRLKQKTSKIGVVVTASAILNIILNFILIPRIGVVGAAIATLITYGIFATLMVLFSLKEIRFNLGLLSISKFLVASAIMALIGIFWNPETILGLIFCILISIAVYFILLFLMGVFRDPEIKLILNSILIRK